MSSLPKHSIQSLLKSPHSVFDYVSRPSNESITKLNRFDIIVYKGSIDSIDFIENHKVKVKE